MEADTHTNKNKEAENQRRKPSPSVHRSLSKNTTVSISRSTPSLPDLVNHALSSATVGLSNKDLHLSMRRGLSVQHTQELASPPSIEEQPRKNVLRKRRHSFTTFLNLKLVKRALPDEDLIEGSRTILPTVADFQIDLSSKLTMSGRPPKTHTGKKGHRPRSYSEITYNIPHVERAPPVAITNKMPAYEYYGFAMYLASFVAFSIYIIWAYVPDEILHSLGITYYPNRYWALAVPIWLMTLVWFIFFSFVTINLMNTKPFNSLNCITDEHANLALMDNELISNRPSDWIPELHDIPINLVNKLLYQQEE